LVQRLLAFALDGDTSDNVALAAIRDALDRAGVSAKQALELSATTEPKPYDDLLADIAGIATITRAESRAARGLPAPETPELPPPPGARALPELVDAELVEPDADRPISPPDSAAEGVSAAEGRRVPVDRPQPPCAPMNGLVSFEEAVTETRQVRRVRRTTRRLR
jgi:hypothetical protein